MAKILVVDDSLLQRLKLKKLFLSEGYEVSEANSGEKCLEILEKEDFDAISLDLLMPGIGGLGVLKELQSKTNAPPAVVLSADIQATVAKECTELGASGFLNKPAFDDDVISLFSRLTNE